MNSSFLSRAFWVRKEFEVFFFLFKWTERNEARLPACQNYQRCLCVNCIECILADRFTISESRNSLIPLIRNADRRILRLSNCEIFCRVLGPIGQLALPSFRPAWMHPKNLPFFICKPPKSPCVPRNKSVSVSDLIVCQWWLVSIVKFDSAELTSATQQDCWIRSRSTCHRLFILSFQWVQFLGKELGDAGHYFMNKRMHFGKSSY